MHTYVVGDLLLGLQPVPQRLAGYSALLALHSRLFTGRAAGSFPLTRTRTLQQDTLQGHSQAA